ncbi:MULTISPECIES: hypothetical protein [Vibrio]|uniref:hypothetical protein n=1 Tax=Vibrio TaxID=662 RepID=UPI0005EFFDE1|nr:MULTISPECIES: hypothetical protein [Vibrio]MDK9777727.1 hypothetical protein [Vibrio sp. D401a]MDK9801153.1 hypothetical protein [Vibrio sp. D406a]USD50980.1 hypothetical protein J4N37_05275 [Vibrio sp. SCSIO 43153]
MRSTSFFFFIALIQPQITHAVTWEESLKLHVTKAYVSLDRKIAICRENKKPLKKIADDWFINMPKNEKLAAATYIQYLADRDCWGAELLAYESALLAYSAEVEDKTLLESWLYLSKVPKNIALKDSFENMDVSKLISWYQSQGGVSPFDFQAFLMQYSEFQSQY